MTTLPAPSLLTRRAALAALAAPATAALLAACGLRSSGGGPLADGGERVEDLQRRHALLEAATRVAFGPGALEVLGTGYEALRVGKRKGKWLRVGLEDLWAHAIKEGSILFENPERRWGKTGPEETKDLIGQTTIGPWQITVQNVKTIYGPTYGVEPTWSDEKVYTWARENPIAQASMIADLIEQNYGENGFRNPYAIQRYFWLEAFVKGEIGQGRWDDSVLAKPPPGGTWEDLTAEDKRRTGFYGKQLVCGTKANPRGLLYWLAVTRDEAALGELLRNWRDAFRLTWDASVARAVETTEPAGMAIRPEDLRYLTPFVEEHALVRRLVVRTLAE